MAMNAKHIDYAMSSKCSIITELEWGRGYCYCVACIGEYREVVMMVEYAFAETWIKDTSMCVK